MSLNRMEDTNKNSDSDSDSDSDSVDTAATEKINNDDDVLNENENENEIPSQNEIEMWQNRSTGCLKQLCDWSQLHSNVIGLMDPNERKDVRVLDLMVSGGLTPQENHLRGRLLPSYICSLAHSGKK